MALSTTPVPNADLSPSLSVLPWKANDHLGLIVAGLVPLFVGVRLLFAADLSIETAVAIVRFVDSSSIVAGTVVTSIPAIGYSFSFLLFIVGHERTDLSFRIAITFASAASIGMAFLFLATPIAIANSFAIALLLLTSWIKPNEGRSRSAFRRISHWFYDRRGLVPPQVSLDDAVNEYKADETAVDRKISDAETRTALGLPLSPSELTALRDEVARIRQDFEVSRTAALREFDRGIELATQWFRVAALLAAISLMSGAVGSPMWIPAELITTANGETKVGYVLSEEGSDLIVMLSGTPKTIERVPMAGVSERKFCSTQDANGLAGKWTSGWYDACWGTG